ncbi:MAG TPA: DUF6452 family protein [Prolixibacteraceae bacterium]|nr:DUF6452 family protein [Prolixibacteraceae bacterium]
MKIKIHTFLLILAVVLFVASCDPYSPCEDTDGVQANLGFYSFNGKTLADTSLASLKIYAIDGDSSVFIREYTQKVNKIAVPLSMVADTSVVCITYGKGSPDTLKFYYTQFTRLVSHECGFANFYTLTGIETTTHLIDSVKIRKYLVEYGDEENIKIYF